MIRSLARVRSTIGVGIRLSFVCVVVIILSSSCHRSEPDLRRSKSPKLFSARAYSLYIQHPTGKNGLEEYLDCADSLQTEIFRKLAGALHIFELNSHRNTARKLPLPDWARGKSELEIQQSITNLFGAKLALIKRGNSKPVFDPNGFINPATFSFRGLEDISLLASTVAHILAVKGETREAVNTLTQLVRFTHKIRQLGLVADMVGIRCTEDWFSEIERDHKLFSDTNWDTLIEAARGQLNDPTPLGSAIEAEHSNMLSSLIVLGTDSRAELSPMLRKDLDALGAQDRKELVDRAVVSADLQIKQDLAILSGPIDKWPWPGDRKAESVSEGDKDVDGLLQLVLPDASTFASEAVNRVQFKLLIVDALIHKFRLKQGRLPSDLGELVAASEITDPLGGAPFIYRVAHDGYSLSSIGKRGVSPIFWAGSRQSFVP